MKKIGKMLKGTTNGRSDKPAPPFVTIGGYKGEVNLQWDAVKNAKQYIIQVSGRDAKWKHVDIISEPQYTISGLGSGKKYLFRIAPVFIDGQGSWSRPAEKKVK